jgi:hypothetical protein
MTSMRSTPEFVRADGRGHTPSQSFSRKTPNLRPKNFRRSSRRNERGAILVEATVVISLLTLGLLGLAFFRDYYINQIKVSRLARAAVLAHSMVGCEDSHKEWIGKDLSTFSGFEPSQQSQTAAGDLGPSQSYAAGADAPPEASGFLGQVAGTTNDGEGLLNPITTSRIGGLVRATNASSPEPGERRTFEAQVISGSHVTCGDRVRKRNYSEILDMTKDQIMMLMGLGGA